MKELPTNMLDSSSPMEPQPSVEGPSLPSDAPTTADASRATRPPTTPGVTTPNYDRFHLLVEGTKDYAIFLLDPDGVIATWNPGAAKIYGYSDVEIVGEHFTRFYNVEALDMGWPQRELELALERGRFEDEGWRVRKDGSFFWANVVITPLNGGDGKLIGYSKITRDLTERRQHEESLRQSEERFRLLVEWVQDYAIILLDPEGYVGSWNAGAERTKGYTSEEIVGRHFSLFYPPEDLATGKPARLLQVARDEGRIEDEGWRMRKDGSRFWASVVITALRNDDGRLIGFAKLTRDLSERQRVEALEQAGRRMTEFLAMLAHELRNPLAPILNAVSFMRMKRIDDPSLQWSREVIERQVSHLTRLVDDLLDISRITSGKITLRREPLDLAIVVDRAVESSRPFIDARGQHLAVHAPPEPVRVHGDLTRLAQVVINLLNNASKFTPRGGEIHLGLEVDASQALLRVRDNGAGIDPEIMPRIFDIFMQGTSDLDRSEGGLGIGLALVRRLVEMHGGGVEALSAGPGRGSEFIVRLPRIATTEAPAHGPSDASPRFETSPQRVLVVDDNRDSAETMAMLIGTWGHEVHAAHDGPTALAIAAELRPAFVLLDLGLPGMNGFEVQQRLREVLDKGSVVIAAVTGYGQEEDRRRTAEVGFDFHFVKPVAPSRLRELLAALPPAAALPG